MPRHSYFIRRRMPEQWKKCSRNGESALRIGPMILAVMTADSRPLRTFWITWRVGSICYLMVGSMNASISLGSLTVRKIRTRTRRGTS